MTKTEAIEILQPFRDAMVDQHGCPISDAVYALDVAIETLKQSEQRWIPVTERVPEIDMSYPHHVDYLVQYDSGNMDVASWSNVNRFWTDHVTEPYWNCVQFAEVIAWRELPEPWKGEDDETD